MPPSEHPDVQNLKSHCLQVSQQFCVTTNSASHQLPATNYLWNKEIHIYHKTQCSPEPPPLGNPQRTQRLKLSRIISHSHKPAPTAPSLLLQGTPQPPSLLQAFTTPSASLHSLKISSFLLHYVNSSLQSPSADFMLILDGALTKNSIISGFIVFPSTFASPRLPHGFPLDCSLISDHPTTPSTL